MQHFPRVHSYDLVFSNQVIHCMADKNALLGSVSESEIRGRFMFMFNGVPVFPPVVKIVLPRLYW